MVVVMQEEKVAKVYKVLEQVFDPEIPVLNVLDLGVIRDVIFQDDTLHIAITPTYSGCPAMQTMKMDIRLKMLEIGFSNVEITEQLSPAWTTDDMSETGKSKLLAYGIVPPKHSSHLSMEKGLTYDCPLCNSQNTRLLSEFSSTSCKAIRVCNECLEPFEVFKCHHVKDKL